MKQFPFAVAFKKEGVVHATYAFCSFDGVLLCFATAISPGAFYLIHTLGRYFLLLEIRLAVFVLFAAFIFWQSLRQCASKKTVQTYYDYNPRSVTTGTLSRDSDHLNKISPDGAGLSKEQDGL